MKKRLVPLALCLALCLGLCSATAGAVGVEELFPPVQDFSGYTDVPEQGQDVPWYAAAVRVCSETGLMNGTGGGLFSPDSPMTVAEAATLAARIRAVLTGESIPDADGAWYVKYISYLSGPAREEGQVRLLSRLAQPDDDARRADFFGLMALAVPQSLLEPINDVPSLPDTDRPEFLAFYRAGILSGTDRYGTFAGLSGLQRCQAAAMTARVIRPALRERFTLAPVPPLCAAAGVLPEEVWFRGGAAPVTSLQYLTQALPIIRQLEEACAAQGIPFNWHNTVDGQRFDAYVKAQILAALGVTADQATESFRGFDLQIFYSRYLDYEE